MLKASYGSMKSEVKDGRLDVRRFVEPLTGMPATEDPVVLNSRLEEIIRVTGKKPMAILVSLSFPPPPPPWLREARANLEEHPSNQKIIKRYDSGFWTGTDIQQKFVKVLNLVRCMAGVIICYVDETGTSQWSKVIPLEDSLYGALSACPYGIHMMSSKMAEVKAVLGARGKISSFC